MRNTLRTLGADAFDCDSWWKARRQAANKPGHELTDDELEQRLEAQAADYATRMTKTFSTKLATNPALAARALNIYFGRKLPELLDHLREFVPDDDGAEETEVDLDADF